MSGRSKGYDPAAMRWLADIVYLFAGLLYLPVVVYQILVVGKNRRGWGERFGFVRRFEPARRRIWIHAVSLGEINATPHLVETLYERLPDIDIVFSTTTDTGYARAVQLFGADHVFRFPLDFSPIVARVLRRVKPSLIVLVELEVWYNLVLMVSRQRIPVAVVNGRLTRHSTRRFRWLGPLTRSLFGRLAWVGAQDETIASRFHDLGVPRNRIEVTSSLKWDTAEVVDAVEGADALAKSLGLDGSRPLWVCGSTGPGEEAQILDAYRRLQQPTPSPAREGLPSRPSQRKCAPFLRSKGGGPSGTAVSVPHPFLERGWGTQAPTLAIVPRKPERFDEVARLIEGAGFCCVRRSRHGNAAPIEPLPPSAVVLGDTMGELRKFYSLADVVFVGRTLVPMGGSDPMEVAALGKPIVAGPHTDNFRLPVSALLEADAIRIVESAQALPSVVGALLANAETAAELGRRARQVVRNNQGATRRTADALAAILSAAR